MGLRDSTYQSIQMMILAKEQAYRNRLDTNNPFQWEQVVLNLPFTWEYKPELPWVFKMRKDGDIACEVYCYVDDGKIMARNRIECWQAASTFAKTLAYLGIQDAIRQAGFEPQLRTQQYEFRDLPEQMVEQVINY